MSFTPEQVAHLEANREFVEYRRLFELVLLGETFRLAESEIEVTSAGHVWQPGLQLIESSPIERSDAFDAVPVEYVVAGLSADPTDDAVDAFDEMVIQILTNPTSWQGGTVHQWLQMMVDGVAVGPAISMHRGWIRDVRPVESAGTAHFRVQVESIFARRNRTPLGEYTDRDQQRRHPGDLGCEFTPSLEDKVVEGWPY